MIGFLNRVPVGIIPKAIGIFGKIQIPMKNHPTTGDRILADRAGRLMINGSNIISIPLIKTSPTPARWCPHADAMG